MEANSNESMREALEDISRTLYNEALYCCTEKAMIGKYDNTQLSLCKSCAARGCECWQMTLAQEARAALAKPPRACDVMSQEDLTKVVINGFMKSLGIGQENQLVSELSGAAISAAIKCAYDTQLVSKEVEGAK